MVVNNTIAVEQLIAPVWSQYDEVQKMSAWPLPLAAGCKDLGASASKLKMLGMFPKRGDIFLKYSTKKDRFYHTGVVLSAKLCGDGRYDCVTVEGNTSDSGSPEGDSVLIRPRVLDTKAGDRFVRWSLRPGMS